MFCKTSLGHVGDITEMGNWASFSIIHKFSAQIGIAFGVSYSMPSLSILNWITTSTSKRIARVIIGVGILFLTQELTS